jgi:hypothetical protein
MNMVVMEARANGREASQRLRWWQQVRMQDIRRDVRGKTVERGCASSALRMASTR